MSNLVQKISRSDTRLKIFDYEGFLSDRIRNHNIDMFVWQIFVSAIVYMRIRIQRANSSGSMQIRIPITFEFYILEKPAETNASNRLM
jgi:hypothetical protein